MTPTDVFLQFVRAINHHDLPSIAALLTPNHTFINSLGQPVHGAPAMQAGWRGYFAMCPDFFIRTDHILSQSNTVLATGESGGTIDTIPWRTPTAWQAVIHDQAIAEWRVFADNKPVYDILAKRSPS